MLVFTRRLGERVVMRCQDGTEIVVTVTELRDGKVRLGFSAPRSVTIHREEVQIRVDAGERK